MPPCRPFVGALPLFMRTCARDQVTPTPDWPGSLLIMPAHDSPEVGNYEEVIAEVAELRTITSSGQGQLRLTPEEGRKPSAGNCGPAVANPPRLYLPYGSQC